MVLNGFTPMSKTRENIPKFHHITENSSISTSSVGRCVIPCAFLIKVSNIHFLVEKCILFKKKDVYNFSLAF